MSQSAQIVVILALLVPLFVKARRNFIDALSYAVFLFVSMTTFLRIQMPGNLPQLTVHRILLVALAFFWWRYRRAAGPPVVKPLVKYLAFWVVVNLISTVFTTADAVNSAKRFLDYTLEVFAFYFIVVTSLNTREEAAKLLRAAVSGLTLVAVLAFVERYLGFNPVRSYLTGDEASGVESTYQHRILLGTAMAMGAPLVFALDGLVGKTRRWLTLIMLVATCYFANSRGPWLACGLALGTLAFFGPPPFRRGLAILAMSGVLLVILRPGVAETLTNRASESTQADTFKGGTFRYRLELWKVAWAKISESPGRLLIGFGPGAGAETAIEWKLSYRNSTMLIESWDSHFAYDLYQTGVLGLIATVALYLRLLLDTIRLWSRADAQVRGQLICVVASVVSMIFMMTNVLIFAKQLFYLFWSVVAIGYVLPAEEASESPEEDTEGDLDPQRMVLSNS